MTELLNCDIKCQWRLVLTSKMGSTLMLNPHDHGPTMSLTLVSTYTREVPPHAGQVGPALKQSEDLQVRSD